MRFTIPGDGTVRPGSKRPVRSDDFIIDLPTPSSTAALDSLVNKGSGGAWERIKVRGAASIIAYGYGPQILADGKASAHTYDTSECIDLDAEPAVLDAIIAAIPAAFAAEVDAARTHYEARVALLAADQSGVNDFIAALPED